MVLLTQEFYQEASQRLTPGGVLASFIPCSGSRRWRSWSSGPSGRCSATCRSSTGPGTVGTYVLGSQAPISSQSGRDPGGLRQPGGAGRPAGRARLPARSTAPWVSIIRGDVWLTNNQVNAYTGAGPLLTDDHPLTEYFLLAGSSPRAEVLPLRLCLVVTGLLVLLIVGAAVSFASRRRTRSAT